MIENAWINPDRVKNDIKRYKFERIGYSKLCVNCKNGQVLTKLKYNFWFHILVRKLVAFELWLRKINAYKALPECENKLFPSRDSCFLSRKFLRLQQWSDFDMKGLELSSCHTKLPSDESVISIKPYLLI